MLYEISDLVEMGKEFMQQAALREAERLLAARRREEEADNIRLEIVRHRLQLTEAAANQLQMHVEFHNLVVVKTPSGRNVSVVPVRAGVTVRHPEESDILDQSVYLLWSEEPSVFKVTDLAMILAKEEVTPKAK